MPSGKRKDSVSVNAHIGGSLLTMLEAACALTGQSKTVAVERAIRALCSTQPLGGQARGSTPDGREGTP